MLIAPRTAAKQGTISCDVCIVGGGAAGITLARELLGADVDVVLLEAGKRRPGGPAQRLYAGTASSAFEGVDIDMDRCRGLGGTTAMWGGRCGPFDPIDFERRDHVPHSGWPVSRADLDDYYRRAHKYLDCGPYDYRAASALPDSPPEMIGGLRDGAIETETLERWSPPTHFGKSFGTELAGAARLKVLLGAVATRLVRNETGDVSHVHVRFLNGGDVAVSARNVVVAGGGLESTRLLLASGIGDHSGWLGRGYMTHLQGVAAQLVLNEGVPLVFGYERDPSGVYCRRRLTLSAETQRAHRLLNMYFLLDRPLLSEADHGSAVLSLAYLAKRLIQRQSRDTSPGGKYAHYLRHIRNIVTGSPEVLSVLPRFGRDRFLDQRRIPSLLLRTESRRFHLFFHAEQSPDRRSQIRLSNDRDAVGMPRLRVDSYIADEDLEKIGWAHLLIDEELRRSNVGRLEFDDGDLVSALRRSKLTLGHHLGTTRMAARPDDGVVDVDCRVYGTGNLFIASGSVFPTCSQAHPTMTVVAFAIRLAEHLRRRCSA